MKSLSLAALVTLLVALAFRSADVWMGMLGAMTVALAAAFWLRRRVRPTAARVLVGLAGAGVLIGLTHLALAAVPGMKSEVAFLYRWKEGHGTAFLAATLVVAGENRND